MFEDIYNFMPLSETLFSGGIPSAEQLQDGTEHGVNLVINLAPHNAPGALPEEKSLSAHHFDLDLQGDIARES